MYTRNKSTQLKESFERISPLTGQKFFSELVAHLSRMVEVSHVLIGEYHPDQKSITTLAFSQGGKISHNFSYLIEGTPCEQTIQSSVPVYFAGHLTDLFPEKNRLAYKLQAAGYYGIALKGDAGQVNGTLALFHSSPVDFDEALNDVLVFIADRAAAELSRFRREREILHREHQLRGLINGVQDLLINLNDKGFVVMLNATAEAVLELEERHLNRHHISMFLNDAGKSKLLSLIENLQLSKADGKYIWIPGTLEIISSSNERINVEGTLSRYDLGDKVYYTLVLRRQDGKADSGEHIKRLIHQTEYVREEVEDLRQDNQMLGESNSVKRLLQNIYMVAHTDATVLINGETGTGKELVARHIHATSNRKDKPMISINCGAIPPSLIESEFFGHAKGAFTGATAERKGRFHLADGGTIFLDEIGELPLDLQVKLLRVIQESEFEPVGSSKTIRVNVRIIAATHRNLFELTKENKFREDLYYRLNVFPIEVPPLRERDQDVAILANAFIGKFARKINKQVNPLSPEQVNMLRSYHWPGNIRELQNVIERSVILAQGGVIDLSTTLGFVKVKQPANSVGYDDDRILTKEEMLEFEKNNIIKALRVANWKVSGKNGAAALLNMVPSTLSSRIQALSIKTPGA